MTDSGIEFRANENVTDIELELTNRVTDLSGVVTNSRGAAVKDYSVVVFAQDRDKWTPNSRYMRTGRPDQDGRFKVTGLPPGEYHIVALDYVDTNEWTEPEYLERVRSKATSVTHQRGRNEVGGFEDQYCIVKLQIADCRLQISFADWGVCWRLVNGGGIRSR